ncbi:phage tail tape measure protein [Microbacterium sp.]|uniref:phage tail tape measure protein n=1 Tax=Microbacterium sp. TaxID=51671 RepID=UPI0039193D24
MTTRLRAAELEVLFTANTEDVPRAEKVIKAAGDRIEKKPITQKVDADVKGAVAGMKQVEDAARRIVSAKTVAKVDAEITGAEKAFTRLYEKVDYLRAIQPEMQVDADITRAVKQMERAQARLDGLRGARAVMEVDADTQPLEDATDGVGKRAGKKVGGDIEGSLIAALTAIPIAGGIVLAGKAIGEGLIGGIRDGMAVEVREDRLQALTGVSPEQARKFAFVSGEAYANTFGESIESNMNVARLGLQFGIIDEKGATRDAQKVIEGLSGIADALEEDVKPTATVVATLLRTGLAGSAQEAFDLLATGARKGLNRSDDLLDSLTEYPTVMRELGLSGKEYLGLLNQGMDAGARNTDIVADGLKEIQLTLRNREGADALRQLGLNVEDTFTAFAEGGPRARKGLEEILTGMRDIEDPVQRNQVALDLFKTKAEDLGDALFSLDLSSAVDQLGQVEGAAQRMFDTLADNDQTRVDRAFRNVEVAVQGIQGALATVAADPLGDVADWVSQNRGPLIGFIGDLAKGAFDFGIALAEGTAAGAESLGRLVSGPLATAVAGFAQISAILGQTENAVTLAQLAGDMRGFESETDAAAETIRGKLIPMLQDGRDKVGGFIDQASSFGYLNDASLRLADSLSVVGLGADGAKLSLEGVDAANLRASESGSLLDSQLRSSVSALQDELAAARDAGESQDQLAGRYDATRQALYDSLIQMGLTEDQANHLIEAYGAVPELVPTTFTANVTQALEATKNVLAEIGRIPRVLNADVTVSNGMTMSPRALGALDLPRGLTPLSGGAQVVPPRTYRVVGDRSDVAELFAPLDGSPRSWSLLMEGFRRMPGVMPMAEGGIVGQVAAAVPSVNVGPIDARVDMSPREHELRRLILDVIREYNKNMFSRGGL